MFIALCLAMSGQVFSQERCGMSKMTIDRMARFSAFQDAKSAADARYQKDIHSSSQGGLGTERIIPVVVHVIQQTNTNVISDDRVQSQIDVFNEDFGKYNADTSQIPLEFQGVAANCNIRFCLAKIDPNGCPTTGINRFVDPVLAIHNMDDEGLLKGAIQWDPHRYLNVWVPVTIEDGILGYATFPDWLGFDPGSDGVVITGSSFGRGFGTPAGSYNLGRTGTHEVGHWLGLYHTFDGGCSGMSPQNCSSQGDMVCDTPPTSNSNFGCPNVQNTCNESPVDANDQTMNYMDYTDDLCMQMFSLGQLLRIDSYLNSDRSMIWSDSNLTLTGCDGTVSPGCQPIAAFEQDIRVTCVGQPVRFTDRSDGPATSWNWTFQGGTPATSTLAQTDVTWASPGLYTVTLHVSNAVGSDSVVQTATVYVSNSVQAPFSESFEDSTGLPLGWYQTSESSQWHWEVNAGASSHLARSVVAHNFAQLAPRMRQDLISGPYDLAGLANPILTFDHAYKRKGGFNVDSLQLWVSPDCGISWQKVWEKTGFALATVSGFQANGPFVPTASQWKSDTVDLAAFNTATELRLMFRSIGGNSQDIHLDNLNLGVLVGTAAPVNAGNSIVVSPNPSHFAPQIEIRRAERGKVNMAILNLQGEVIHFWGELQMSFGPNQVQFPADVWGEIPSGLYFLKVYDSKGMFTAKLVKLGL
jgi:PKD repeat protein